MEKGEASDKTSAGGNVHDTQLNRTLTDLNINSEKQTEASSKDAPADFETAMNVAGFGTFNILLLICALPAAMATVLETSVISYILPSAECDLKLTLIDKGLLNGITYVADCNVPDTQLNRTLTDLNINSEKQTEASSKDAPADFETAMNVAGFGTFNILLLISALPAVIAAQFETATISYILPSAACDLKLSLIDRGLLNAIIYVGMITSAILWGYVADTKGRKKLLISGYLTNIISILGAACSQNVIQLMVFKFISGFIMCGPFAVLMSYLSELHGKTFRSRIVMLLGLMFSLGNILLPVVALGVLPSHWDFQILGLQFHSWQIFLALSTIPCLLGGVLLSFFPESPKFLMSQGRNAEALRIFQRIYAMNNRKPREDYPIKELINEQSSSEKTSDDASTVSIATIEESIPKEKETVKPKLPKLPIKEKKPKLSLRQGLQQLRPLLRKPYLGLSLQVYLINFAILLGQNTLRLWMPQMFASIEEYEQRHGTEDATMCTILEYSVNKTQSQITQTAINKCEVIITAASYTNNITVAITSCVGYLLAGFVINRIGSKMLLAICSIIAGLCAIGLYFSISALSTLIIISVSVSVGSISAMSVISSSVDLFPTSLRTMIVSLAMMFGRTGSILGNILFPIFMSLGCIPPFIMLAFVMFSAGIMSAFLPSTRKTVLK